MLHEKHHIDSFLHVGEQIIGNEKNDSPVSTAQVKLYQTMKVLP